MISKGLLFLWVFVAFLGTATADPQFNMDFLNKSAKILEQAAHQPNVGQPKTPTITEGQQRAMQAILMRSQKSVHSSLSEIENKADKKEYKAKEAMRNRQIAIAVTLSSKFDIKGALTFLKSYKDDKQVRIVIAGLPKGCRTFQCAGFRFHDLGVGEDFPPVTIDPKIFKDRNITMAPTMIYTGKDGVEIARVEGLWDPIWLREQVSNGKHGDLGIRGPVVDIEEKNMMDEIASRINKIDVKKKIKEAKASYWKDKRYVDLPASNKDRQIMFEPIVTATADIKDAKGNVIVAKGTTVNALAKMPFTRSIIVYNPNRRGERALAIKLMKDAIRRGKQPVMIITKPNESSFQSVFDEQKSINAPVFLLSNALAKRMQITHTVSVVEAEDMHFIVKEFGMTGIE